jgi:hypothetical protein
MSKEVVMKHLCMTMCWTTNKIVIRTRYEKRGGAHGGGGGEKGGVKG